MRVIQSDALGYPQIADYSARECLTAQLVRILSSHHIQIGAATASPFRNDVIQSSSGVAFGHAALAEPILVGFFDGISEWPNLTRALHLKACDVIDNEGWTEFCRCDGRRRHDNLFTFAFGSSRFLEVTFRLLSYSPGVRFVDESGLSWALCFDRPSSGGSSMQACGVSFDGPVEALDSELRSSIRESDGQWQFVGPARPGFARPDVFMRELRLAETIEQALFLLEWFQFESKSGDELRIGLSDVARFTGEGSRAITKTVSLLIELTRFRLCRFDLSQSFEQGHVQRRSIAVSRLETVPDVGIRISISPDLRPTLSAFQR